MLNLSSFFRNFSSNQDKNVFHFFEIVTNSIFIVIVGLFFTIFLSVFSFSLLFFSPIYNQISIFTALGIIFFTVSYSYFLSFNSSILSNLTYDTFLISSSNFCSWVIWTFNFYLLFCWFVLIILGSTNGFNINFPTGDSQLALIVTDADNTNLLGFVLLCVHMFLLLLINVVIYYWSSIFNFAANEFESSSNNLEAVSSKAKLNQ